MRSTQARISTVRPKAAFFAAAAPPAVLLPTGLASPPCLRLLACRGRSFLSMKIDEKKRMQEMVSGHRTGLPDKLLRLFAARAPLEPNKGPPRRSRPPKLPYTGVAQYVHLFAEPGDPEYEPPPPETRPPEPRVFTNPEMPSQVGAADAACPPALPCWRALALSFGVVGSCGRKRTARHELCRAAMQGVGARCRCPSTLGAQAACAPAPRL